MKENQGGGWRDRITLAAYISGIVNAFYDNDSAFEKYLAGLHAPVKAAQVGLRMRKQNRIVPKASQKLPCLI
jgi:hypothetical protein